MKTLAIALASTLLSAGTALADGSLKQLTMAQDVLAYGLEMQDPFAVLTAANMTAAVHVTDVERQTETRPGSETSSAGDDAESEPLMDAAQMYAIAKEFAGGDDYLIGLIEDAEAEGSRGQTGGASRTLNRVQAGYVDMVRLEFEGGKLAELAILGADGANLDLKVTDALGNTICNEQDASDKLYCAWTPDETRVYFAEVENVSGRRNSYYVLTN